MTVIKRYQSTLKGALSITGNTLGLAGDQFGNGVLNFTTATPNPPSGGTTTVWQNNSASAFLVLPSDAVVTYAELTWGAQYTSAISSNLNTSITFTTPLGINNVAPDPATSQSITTQVGENFYTRTQNVTDLVKAAGAGKYTVGGVPSFIGGGNNYVGWTLIVAYQSNSMIYRNITIWSLLEHVQGGFGNVDVPISGFATPATGVVNGRIAVSAGGGNPDLTGDFMKFGPTSISATTLSGPNNLPTDFFSSQINNNAGLLDTTGTWGTANTTPPARASTGNRNSYDITNVSTGTGLTNNQTTGDIVLGTTNDTYDAVALGIQVDINAPLLTPIAKIVNNPYADIGYVLTYTVSFTNKGQLSADNAVFIDTVPSYLNFVPNSLNVNGVSVSGTPDPPGINIGNIAPNQSVTISFSGVVKSLPNPNTISNIGSIFYNFSPGPGLATIPALETSNIITTTINNVNIVSTKSVNKTVADIGDTITYTVSLANTGTTTAINLVFIDTIPTGTTFVANSLRQDGNLVSGNPSFPGVTLPNSIAKNGISIVTFNVLVNTLPNPNPIPNNATTTFKYNVNPTIPITTSSVSSTNTVYTQINTALLNTSKKSVNKAYSRVSDTLVYTITLSNTGNVSANNITLIDTIPNGTTFVPNSVFIGGIQKNGFNPSPPSGISVGSLGPNSVTTVSFNVVVNTIPNPNPVLNSAYVTYNYIVDPTLSVIHTNSINTNVVSTTINSAIINSVKNVSAINSVVGDVINYTVNLSNSGNATANNIVFIDTIPTGTSFIANSLKFNGVTQPGQSPAPPSGFNIGSIAPNGSASIQFQVVINTIPNPNPIPNESSSSYNFIVNPTTGETAPNTSVSNTVSTYVNPISNPSKMVDKIYATTGDILTYEITWKNVLNINQTNVILIDTIPNDTTFIPNSINVNGTTIPGATINPPSGINLGTLPSGSIFTVTFKVSVDRVPTPNPIPNQVISQFGYVSDPTLGIITTETQASNFVNTQINVAKLTNANKSVDKVYAAVGENLNYTVTFANTGNITANNVTLIDTLPNGTAFVINSVTVNNTSKPGAVIYPPTGLNIGDVGVNSVVTVVYQVSVTTIPNPNPIPNSAFLTSTFIIDPVVSSTSISSTNTNTAFTQVNTATIGNPSKLVDKVFATIGDTITYTVVLKNTGNATADNMVISDTIPNGTSFIPQSVVINNVPNTTTTPTGGLLSISAGNIAPNGTATLSFKVLVNTIPSPNPIPNSASSYFKFTSNPSIVDGNSSNLNTNTVLTQVNFANLSNITKFVDKVFTTCQDTLIYTVSISNTGNVSANNVFFKDTIPNGTSFVVNSVMINGVTQSGLNPGAGFNIGSISPGATSSVSFKVIVQC